MAKVINLYFDGYYREKQLPLLKKHDCSGIYMVYTGKPSQDKYELRKLLYIGRSKDISERPSPLHHKYKDWHAHLNRGEILYFSFADTDDDELAEAALIYKAKPICNDKGKEDFKHQNTTIKASGYHKYLDAFFTLINTEGWSE
jgi:hypothetical protein